MLISNTRLAFKLVDLSTILYDEDLTDKLVCRLFHSAFCENRKLSNIDTLIDTAVSAGMDERKIKRELLRNYYLKDTSRAIFNGISSVPCIIYNNAKISGLQTTETYKKILTSGFKEYNNDYKCHYNQNKMLVEFMGDFTSPDDYVTYYNLKKALSDFNIELEFVSFEAHPQLGKRSKGTVKESFTRVLGEDGALETINDIQNFANKEGLKLNYGDCQITNTLDAHRLIYFVKYNYGNETANKIVEDLFKSVFVDNEKLSDKKVLSKIALNNGITEDIQTMLKSKDYINEINYITEYYSKFREDSSPCVFE